MAASSGDGHQPGMGRLCLPQSPDNVSVAWHLVEMLRDAAAEAQLVPASHPQQLVHPRLLSAASQPVLPANF